MLGHPQRKGLVGGCRVLPFVFEQLPCMGGDFLENFIHFLYLLSPRRRAPAPCPCALPLRLARLHWHHRVLESEGFCCCFKGS